MVQQTLGIKVTVGLVAIKLFYFLCACCLFSTTTINDMHSNIVATASAPSSMCNVSSFSLLKHLRIEHVGLEIS